MELIYSFYPSCAGVVHLIACVSMIQMVTSIAWYESEWLGIRNMIVRNDRSQAHLLVPGKRKETRLQVRNRVTEREDRDLLVDLQHLRCTRERGTREGDACGRVTQATYLPSDQGRRRPSQSPS